MSSYFKGNKQNYWEKNIIKIFLNLFVKYEYITYNYILQRLLYHVAFEANFYQEYSWAQHRSQCKFRFLQIYKIIGVKLSVTIQLRLYILYVIFAPVKSFWAHSTVSAVYYLHFVWHFDSSYLPLLPKL